MTPELFDSRFLIPANRHGIRVAFVQPRIPDGNYLPNLGIMTLSAILLREGYDVQVFDENLDGDVVDAIVGFSPALVGFTCVTAAIGATASMAKRVKAQLPQVTLMIGGPHLSAVPKETLETNPIFDFGITGEGEKPL